MPKSDVGNEKTLASDIETELPRISQAEGKHLGPSLRAVGIRVVGRNQVAINTCPNVEAQKLTLERKGVLRRTPGIEMLIPVAKPDVELAVARAKLDVAAVVTDPESLND